MKVYLVRHAIAEDQEKFSQPDELRPLTAKGRDKLKKVLKGLSVLAPSLDRLYCSPLVRAVQTAEYFTAKYGVTGEKTDALSPTASPEAVLRLLEECGRQGSRSVALVGHEPQLNRLVSWLTIGRPAEILLFKKAGVCCLEFSDGVGRAKAEIVWFMGPSQLIELGQ